jgi:hypothetical protein
MSSWLKLYNFKGCAACPFAREDGSPCDRNKFDVRAVFRSPQFLGDAQVFMRGQKIIGTGVVVNGVLYCMKAFSKTLRNHYCFVDLNALLPSSVHLIVETLKPNPRRKRILLKQRGIIR